MFSDKKLCDVFNIFFLHIPKVLKFDAKKLLPFFNYNILIALCTVIVM